MTKKISKTRPYFWGHPTQAICFMLAGVLLLISANSAHARKDSVYTLAKVKLDVRADNAVEAKEMALEGGPLQALKLIFKRLAPFRAYDRLNSLTLADADSVTDGFAVRSERNSSTRYLALLDYNFSPKKLQALLTQKGVPFFDRRSGRQVLMPVYVAGKENKAAATNQKNWWRAWQTIDLKHALTDTRLYKAKTSDQNDWQKITTGDQTGYDVLRGRYATRKLILTEVRLSDQQDRLTLRLFGEDYMGRIDYSQEIPVTAGVKDAFENAAKLAFGIVEGRWREPHITGEVVAVAVTSTAADDQTVGRRLVEETVFLRVAFHGLRDWQRINKRLRRVPGVQKLRVNSLSPRGADVRLAYPGGVDRLRTQIASYGFAIDQRGKDNILRSTRR